MRKTIVLQNIVGDFGENKDLARTIRQKDIIPTIAQGDSIALDFTGINGATQSFIHALIAEPIIRYREQAFENLFYINTNDSVSEIISIVYRYLQESFTEMEEN